MTHLSRKNCPLKEDLSSASLKALEYLEDWYKSGAQSDTSIKGTELVNGMHIIFRAGRFPLARVYGGGGSGLANFAKTISARFRENPHPHVTPEEMKFVNAVLGNAWNQAVNKYGRDASQWQEKAMEAIQNQRLRYFQNLERFPSLDKRYDVASPSLTVTDGGTIWSQRGQAYTQYVPLHDVDAARTVMPIGQSERPDSPYRFSTYADWSKGILHDAPLSREKVEAITTRRTTLSGVDEGTDEFVIEDEHGKEILPGRGPTDETIREEGIRKLIQKDCSREEVDQLIAMLLEYVEGNKNLTEELVGSFQRVIYLEYGTDYARQKMGETLKELSRKLPPKRPEKFKKLMREKREAARRRKASGKRPPRPPQNQGDK